MWSCMGIGHCSGTSETQKARQALTPWRLLRCFQNKPLCPAFAFRFQRHLPQVVLAISASDGGKPAKLHEYAANSAT